MKFIVIGKYTKQGTDGWVENPDEDRHAMIAGMAKKMGGELHDLTYTRGEYDFVATVDATDFNTMTAFKLVMIKSGAIAEMTILESIDLNAVAKQAAEFIGIYKAPGT